MPLSVVLAIAVVATHEFGEYLTSTITAQRDEAVEVRRVANELQRLLLMMDSAMRGYLLSGRPDYLQPFLDHGSQIIEVERTVKAMAARYPAQKSTMQELVKIAEGKRSEMEEVLRRFQGGSSAGAMELLLTDIGREYMERVNELTAEIQRRETLTYGETGRLRDQVSFASRLAVDGLVLLCIWMIFTAIRLGRDQSRVRRLHLAELDRERANLEIQVSQRTAELSALALHLQSVRENERGRLARELHDELGGLLTAAKIDVARVKRYTLGQGADVAERLAHLAEMLDSGISLKRRIIEDLRPSSLDNLGLQRTLEIQCADFSRSTELPVVAEIGSVELPSDRALAVYRLVQEALTNVAKYANAKHVRVVLQRLGDQVQVQVEDDGCGFDPAQLRPGGHGLTGMKFRVQSCGGELRLKTSPGHGTQLDARLPI